MIITKTMYSVTLGPSGAKHKYINTYHYNDVMVDSIRSQITSLTIVYSIVYSDADQRKHQSNASLVFVRLIHRGPVNSPHKWPVTRKMFPFHDVIMFCLNSSTSSRHQILLLSISFKLFQCTSTFPLRDRHDFREFLKLNSFISSCSIYDKYRQHN